MTRPLYTARCASCGLRTAIHFSGPHFTGDKLSCLQARDQHRFASERRVPLAMTLRAVLREVGR